MDSEASLRNKKHLLMIGKTKSEFKSADRCIIYFYSLVLYFTDQSHASRFAMFCLGRKLKTRNVAAA